MRQAVTTLQGWGLDDLVDDIKDVVHDVGHAVGDVFDGITGAVGDVFEATADKLGKALPYLAAAGGFVLSQGNPQVAIAGFRLGSQIHKAQDAKEKGEDAKREYERAMAAANYLASAGIDISGNNLEANRLIDRLQELDYDYKSTEAQTLIGDYIEAEQVRQAETEYALMVGAGIVAVAVLYMLMRRKR